jgi:tripartite-type tricarboxylate transporter receptor subunit TctC
MSIREGLSVPKRLGVVLVTAIVAVLLLVSCSSGGGKGGKGEGGSAESAEEYPSQEIREIVPYAAGGPTDLAGRGIAAYFEEALGQPVVVENQEGASATIGTTELVNSEPNGYTLEMATTSPLVLVPLLENLPYDKDDVETICVTIQTPAVLAVRQDSEYETAEEFLEAAQANPGTLSVALPGANTPQGVELQRLADEYGIVVTPVPFDGDSEAVAALLGGNVDALFDPAGDVVFDRIESGEFRALAVGSPEPVPYLPDVPTLAELGYETLTLSTSTYGLVAPKGTPSDIISELESTCQAALEDPETREQIGERYIPGQFIGSEEFRTLLDETWETYEPILGG